MAKILGVLLIAFAVLLGVVIVIFVFRSYLSAREGDSGKSDGAGWFGGGGGGGCGGGCGGGG